jgi:CDP-glucose 4,6-dehydratase
VGARPGPLEVVGVNRTFWRGRRVLLTGHTGFKGSWLALWLHELGAEVVGFALPPTSERGLYAAGAVGRFVTSVEGDVRDVDHLQREIERFRPEVVLHLAAQALVRHSFAHPLETYATNVMGTANLLEAARRARLRAAILCVASDKCYENLETGRPYVEGDPLGGHDPYSSSKGCSELVVAAFRDTYFPPERFAEHGVALSSARAGNVIGGGDWAADRLVVDVVAAVLDGRAPLIRNPNAVRPWQFVLEPLAGYLMLAERSWSAPEAFAQAWNFGPELSDCRPVSWVVDRLAAAWGEGASWTRDTRPLEREAQLLLLDAGKARSHLGWRPRLDLAAAIDWTVAWYRGARDGADVDALTRDQIARYEALVGA